MAATNNSIGTAFIGSGAPLSLRIIKGIPFTGKARYLSYEDTATRHDCADQVLARAGGWAHSVRCLPARLPPPRGPARPLLCARPAGPSDRPDHLWPFQRLLRGPHREEAAQPLPARLLGALLWHGGVQPGLQVLPELGHQ